MAIADEFALLMSETTSDSPIDDTRRQLMKFVRHMQSIPEQQANMEAFAELRNLKIETLIKANSFMYPTTHTIAEEFTTADLELQNFRGRYCYPVFTAKGNVAGLVGYDCDESPKYLDSKVYGYKAKTTMLFGMELIEEYYASGKPVIVVEGCVCALILREHGFQALALLGSTMSYYVAQILKRFGSRCIMMPDSDEAGKKFANRLPYLAPEARYVRVTSDKDIDDSREANPNFFKNLEQVIKFPFLRIPL